MNQETILAVVQKSDHSLGFYRIADGAELDRAELGRYPHEFAVSPDRRVFYISEYGVQSSSSEEDGGNQVAIFDVAARRVAGRLSCVGARRPHGIACDRHGALYVLCEKTNRLLVCRAPRVGGEFDETYETGGEKGHMLAVTKDGGLAFFMNIQNHTVTAVRLAEGRHASPQTVCEGQWPEGFCFNRDESLLFVANRASSDITVIDTKKMKKTGSIPARPTPLRMTLDFRGRIVCVHFSEERAVSIINPRDGKEEFVFYPPAAAVFAGLDAAGARAAFSLQNDTVEIYRTDSWSCEQIIRTHAEPDVAAFVRA